MRARVRRYYSPGSLTLRRLPAGRPLIGCLPGWRGAPSAMGGGGRTEEANRRAQPGPTRPPHTSTPCTTGPRCQGGRMRWWDRDVSPWNALTGADLVWACGARRRGLAKWQLAMVTLYHSNLQFVSSKT